MNNLKDLLKEGYPLKEEKPKLPYKIYCDMDGVLTDFESRFEHYTGMHPQAYEKAKGVDGVIVGSAFVKYLLDDSLSFDEKISKISKISKNIKDQINS